LYLPGSDVWGFVILGRVVQRIVLGFATRQRAVAFLTLTASTAQSARPQTDHVHDGSVDLPRAGEVWSVDHWLMARAGLQAQEATAWCSRLMQLQVSIVYFKAFVAKLSGETWRAGSAVYYAVEAAGFRRARLPSFARSWIWSRLATWWTLTVELALGSMVWVRELRYPCLLAGVTLHLLMEVFMNLQLFGVTMIVCLTLFIEP
jgi:hypothetical protein